MSIREQFADDFASSAFQRIEGETVIVGKFVRISQIANGLWDAWFVGEGMAPLSWQKMRALRNALGDRGAFIELDGEAVMRIHDPETVRQAADLGGVKRKRQISEEERRRRTEALTGAKTGRES